VIQVEKEKVQLAQDYELRIKELKLNGITQVAQIRETYQRFLKEYVIICPIAGKVTLHPDIKSQQHINADTPIMYIAANGAERQSSSELFVVAQNAGKIEPGMKVRIGLAEFDQKEYGIYYTTVESVSDVQLDGQYKINLDIDLPIRTSYNIDLPERQTYYGKGEILVGKINLLTKISREISYSRDKYAAL